MITATTDGRRIRVSFAYDAMLVRKMKTIAGHSWLKTDKVWTVPLTPETCHDLRSRFGSDLRISNELADWYREEQAKRREIEMLRAGQVADLPYVREHYAALWDALSNRPFQIAGAAMIVRARQFCLGDEPRLGKTYQALAAIAESRVGTVLVACPKTACTTVWARKINELIPNYMPFVAQEDRDNRAQVIQAFKDMPYGRKVLIVNKEMIRVVRFYECKTEEKHRFRIAPGKKNGCPESHDHKTFYEPVFPELHDITWDAIVLDECHHALASTKNVQSSAISQIRMGAVRLRTTQSALKIAMSGTPFRGKPEYSWGVLNWLRKDLFGSYWRFASDHFDVEEETIYGRGGVPIETTKVGELRDETSFSDFLRPYYLARTMPDVAPDMESITYVDVEIEMSGKQAKAYSDMVRLATTTLENGTLTANGILAELTRLKQFSTCYGRFSSDRVFMPTEPSNKLDWILQFLEERADTDGKVVIASQFTKIVNLFAERIRRAGWQCLTLTGESTNAQRTHAQDEFLTGRTRIIVINMFAGGEAIDLSSADEMIFVDEPDGRDEAVLQAESRIKNLAKAGVPLTVWKLRSAGTIESSIAALNAESRAILSSAKPQAIENLKEMLHAE